MTHKIFLSHNHADKPIVEPVALRLRAIFGESAVFYDSWSIQPGDGILDKMNQGLEAPEFVFFFVTAKSVASPMVKLEWQNALFAASKGKTRMIPIRVDGSAMPPLLTQTLYIDMYSVGLEAALAQIVGVTQGNASFTPQHQGFSNLTFSTDLLADGSLILTVKASHFMEPNATFMLATRNSENEISAMMANNQPHVGGFNANILTGPGGESINGIFFRPMTGAVTPTHPLRIKVSKIGLAQIAILDVLHEAAENQWKNVPFKI